MTLLIMTLLIHDYNNKVKKNISHVKFINVLSKVFISSLFIGWKWQITAAKSFIGRALNFIFMSVDICQ